MDDGWGPMTEEEIAEFEALCDAMPPGDLDIGGSGAAWVTGWFDTSTQPMDRIAVGVTLPVELRDRLWALIEAYADAYSMVDIVNIAGSMGAQMDAAKADRDQARRELRQALGFAVD